MTGPVFDFFNCNKTGPTPEQIEEARASWRAQASAKYNGDFIEIRTYSRHSLSIADPTTEAYLLRIDIGNSELGVAILKALQQSRFLSFEEEGVLMENLNQNYTQWVNKLMKKYGYKTKRALFKKMMSCGIERRDNMIIIRPSNHEKLEGWGGEGISKDDYVTLPTDSSPEEIGAALRLAFSRCIGMGADEV